MSSSILAQKVKNFYKKPRPNVRLTVLHRLFMKEEQVTISYSCFTKLSKKYSKVKTIRTGAAEVRLINIAFCIAERSINHIDYTNTIAIDEKPFVPKAFLVRSARVSKDAIGSIYKAMLYGIKMRPFYLIAAVNVNGLVSYRLKNEPFNVHDFESFALHVSYIAASDRKQYLLCDNASFHGIHPIIERDIQNNGFEITKTPPSGCFCDPIEEFFGILDTKFKNSFYEAMISTGSYVPLTVSEIEEMIVDCIYSSNQNLIKQFERALL